MQKRRPRSHARANTPSRDLEAPNDFLGTRSRFGSSPLGVGDTCKDRRHADEGGAGTPGAPELKPRKLGLKLAPLLATAKLRPPQATGGASHPRLTRMLRLVRIVKPKSTKYWGRTYNQPQQIVDSSPRGDSCRRYSGRPVKRIPRPSGSL